MVSHRRDNDSGIKILLGRHMFPEKIPVLFYATNNQSNYLKMFIQLLLVFFGASGTKFQSSVNRKLAIRKKKHKVVDQSGMELHWNFGKPRFIHQE